MAVGHTARHKLVFQGVKDVDLLLAHCFAELVRFAFSEAGQPLRQKHHLLLIDGDAVGVLKVFLHLRKVVLDGLLSLLAGDEVRDVVHRARPIEGVHSDKVLEALRVELLEVLFHTGGFDLEDGSGVAAAEELVGRLVVDGDGFDVDILAIALLDELEAVVDDAEGDEAEEVHLEHTHILNVVAVILRDVDRLAGVLVLGRGEGEIIGQVASADNGRAGVDADLPDASFQGLCVVEDLLGELVVAIEFIDEIGVQPEAPFESDVTVGVGYFLKTFLETFHHLGLASRGGRVVHLHFFLVGLEAWLQLVELGIEGIFPFNLLSEPVGDHFGEAVGLFYGKTADPRDVLYGTFRGHRAEGDNPRDVVLAVALLDVFVGFGQVLEIYVDIGHTDTVGVEETLEQELVADGVEVGDAEAVGDDAAGGGASPGADHTAGGPRRGYIVLDYQEVVREAHTADGLELELDPFLLLVGQDLAVALVGAFIGKVAQVGH